MVDLHGTIQAEAPKSAAAITCAVQIMLNTLVDTVLREGIEEAPSAPAGSNAFDSLRAATSYELHTITESIIARLDLDEISNKVTDRLQERETIDSVDLDRLASKLLDHMSYSEIASELETSSLVEALEQEISYDKLAEAVKEQIDVDDIASEIATNLDISDIDVDQLVTAIGEDDEFMQALSSKMVEEMISKMKG